MFINCYTILYGEVLFFNLNTHIREVICLIEVKNLVKRYGDHNVVDNLSFSIKPGQIYGFLGPNGAGKSTTMNIITGYIGMTEGEVTVGGHSITEEPNEVRRLIGYLPEQPPLYPDMTPKEYLLFAAELKKIPKDERESAVCEVMERTGITSRCDRLIKNLSKGYRQRVGFAQAILGYPEVIILDEPTVGLDPKQIIEVRQIIRSLAGQHTVILSSHILSEVQEICDHILIIHHGKLIADGTPDELERRVRGNTLEVTVKCDDAAKAAEELARANGVAEVRILSENDEIKAELVPDTPDTDVRESVFRVCAAADMPILGMRYSGMSLERVFLDLTSDKEVTLFDEEKQEVIGEFEEEEAEEA